MSANTMPENPPRLNNPFVGPRAIETGEPLFGRQPETDELADLLLANRIILLYSPSGAGKTSLVQAALVPRMAARSFRVLHTIRLGLASSQPTAQPGSDPAIVSGSETPVGSPAQPGANSYVSSVLASLEEGKSPEERLPVEKLADMRLNEYLDLLGSERLLLIFDQFEEILTLDPLDREGKTEFFEQVGEALQQPDRWALFAIREDYLGGLAPYSLPVPTRFKYTFRLDLLEKTAARVVVQQTARLGNVEFTTQAADRLIDDLASVTVQLPDGQFVPHIGVYVEPLHLQVACQYLWERRESHDSDITADEIKQIGDVDEALAKYYDRQAGTISAQARVQERDLRTWCERRLISDTGIRLQVLKEPQQSAGLDNDAIDLLVDAHLVRRDTRREATWFELTHDRLIAPIRRSNKEWFEINLRPLQRQASRWQTENYPEHLLLSGEHLEAEEGWAEANPQALNDNDRRFLQASQEARQKAQEQRRGKLIRRILFLVLAVLLVVSTLGVFSVIQTINANNLAVENSNLLVTAQTAQAAAETARVDAVNQENIAKTESADAYAQRQTAEAESTRAVAQETIALGERDRANSLAAMLQTQATAQVPINRSRVIAAQALSLLDSQPDISALLSVEAEKIQDTWEALNLLLLRALREQGAQVRPYGSSLPDQPWAVTDVTFSPGNPGLSGSSLAWARLDGSFLVYNLAANTINQYTRHTQQISSLVYSPDGQYLASGGYDRNIYLWEISKMNDPGYKPIRLPNDPEELVLSLSFSPDGNFLAAGVGLFVEIFDLQTYKQVRRMQHKDYVYSLGWSPNGKWLAAGDAKGNLIIWDPTNGQRFRTPGGERLRGVIYSLDWSPDSHLLAIGQYGEVILYDIQTGESLGDPFQSSPGFVLALDFNSDGTLLATGGRDNHVSIWDVTNHRLAASYDDLGYRILGLDFTDGGGGVDLLAVGGTDFASGRLNLLEVVPEFPLSIPVASEPGKVLALGMTSSGELISTSQETISARLGLEGEISTAALGIHDQKTILAAGGQNGQVRLVDWESSQVLAQFELPDQVEALAISPDGAYLAASYCQESEMGAARPVCLDNRIQLWERASGALLDPPLSDKTHDWIRALVFSPDGKQLLSGSYDGTLITWDFRNGARIAESPYHAQDAGGILSLAFDTQGSLLASGTTSGSLVLWDTINFQPLNQQLGNFNGLITSLVFAPDGGGLYSGSSLGTILRLDVDQHQLVQRSCDLAGHNLNDEQLKKFLPDREQGYKICAQYP
jgi:WD40 repeat protein